VLLYSVPEKEQTMRCVLVTVLALLSLLLASAAFSAEDTPHFDVVSEYIRSLGTVHNIQLASKKEMAEDKDNLIGRLMSGIRSSTRMKLELSTSIGALERMTLKEPFETLIPTTIHWYQEKIKLHDETISIAKAFISGPKPGVDYSAMTARMPEITANIEFIDESIFKSMVLVFALLIDMKPDEKGQMSHLNITKAQREKLINDINTSFSSSLNEKNKNWTVSSAALLKAYLQKDYKCIDEWKK
jgi:hypothetical protein